MSANSTAVGVESLNRVASRIQSRRLDIASKGLEPTKLASLHESLDMELDEFCRFQELKSLAFASGKLSRDEANEIYHLLGTTPAVFNSRDLATKLVLTGLFSELLSMQIVGKL